MAPMATQKLSKQEEKSLSMRRRVCEATIAVLASVGYERVSTKLVAEHGKMSRGAVNYHFPTKNDMLVAAYKYVLEDWEKSWPFRAMIEGEKIAADDLIDALWTGLFSTGTYLAVLELMLAARLDENLGARLRAALPAWSGPRDMRTARLIGLDTNDEKALRLLHLNLCMLRGLSVNQFFAAGTRAEDKLIEIWKEIFVREIKDYIQP